LPSTNLPLIDPTTLVENILKEKVKVQGADSSRDIQARRRLVSPDPETTINDSKEEMPIGNCVGEL
jgi:hypothetical protein